MSKLQQGQADGMCGLYAILNFLLSKRAAWSLKKSETLWNILDSCSRLGWLTPNHIVDGFYDHQLKSIMDDLIKRYRLPYETYFLSDVVTDKRFSKFIECSDAVLAKEGAIIANHGGWTHWLLVTTRAGERVIVDSDDAAKPIKAVNYTAHDLSVDWGLVLVPVKHGPKVVKL